MSGGTREARPQRIFPDRAVRTVRLRRRRRREARAAKENVPQGKHFPFRRPETLKTVLRRIPHRIGDHRHRRNPSEFHECQTPGSACPVFPWHRAVAIRTAPRKPRRGGHRWPQRLSWRDRRAPCARTGATRPAGPSAGAEGRNL